MSGKPSFDDFEDRLEDFWGRRQNRPGHIRDFSLCGHQVRLASNDPGLLAAADYATPLYSRSPEVAYPPFTIRLVVRPMPYPPGPLPANLFDSIQYSGDAEWLALHLGSWGHCQIDLARQRAVAVLAPELAERPALVSRYLLNTILTNFLIASGYGFLHATGLFRDERAILLMAAHNSGKSTTALRLALAGYCLLSDSMIFVGDGSPPRLFGFPVGRVKLRPDVIAEFPQLGPLLEEEPARGEIKYAADLRRLDPSLVCETAVQPAEIKLCLLSRGDGTSTRLRPAPPDAVVEAIVANSLFYDTAEVWEQNLARIGPLVEMADCYHMAIGRDPSSLGDALEAM